MIMLYGKFVKRYRAVPNYTKPSELYRTIPNRPNITEPAELNYKKSTNDNVVKNLLEILNV